MWIDQEELSHIKFFALRKPIWLAEWPRERGRLERAVCTSSLGRVICGERQRYWLEKKRGAIIPIFMSKLKKTSLIADFFERRSPNWGSGPTRQAPQAAGCRRSFSRTCPIFNFFIFNILFFIFLNIFRKKVYFFSSSFCKEFWVEMGSVLRSAVKIKKSCHIYTLQCLRAFLFNERHFFYLLFTLMSTFWLRYSLTYSSFFRSRNDLIKRMLDLLISKRFHAIFTSI